MDPMTQELLVMAVVAAEAVALLCFWPLWRIFRRAGLPGSWSATVFVPLVGFWLVGGLLAFVPWPTRRPAPKTEAGA